MRRKLECLTATEYGNIKRPKGFDPSKYGLGEGDWRVRLGYENVGKGVQASHQALLIAVNQTDRASKKRS